MGMGGIHDRTDRADSRRRHRNSLRALLPARRRCCHPFIPARRLRCRERLFARAEGSGLLVVGIVNIIASRDSGSTALWALVLGNLLLHIFGIGIDFTEKFPKTGGWWVGFAVHMIFILAFGWYLLNWPAAPAA